MNTEFRKLMIAVTLTTAITAAPAALAADPPMPTTAVTVYVGMPFGKSAGAKDVNAMHAKMEKDGWRFADLETNNENGDTEGVWLTYTKP